MREVTTKVYEFDELSNDAKQKAIEWYREGQDFPWLADDIANRLEELLKENKITCDFTPNVYFSLSYSQGDGAMFEGTMKWKAWDVSVKQSGHYYHENSKTFELESPKTGKFAPDETRDKFNEVYVSICNELENYGYSILEAETSDENISTYMSEMDYEFNADGSIANY